MVKNRRNISILLLTCHFLLLVGLLYSYFIASISPRYKIFYVSRHPAKFLPIRIKGAVAKRKWSNSPVFCGKVVLCSILGYKLLKSLSPKGKNGTAKLGFSGEERSSFLHFPVVKKSILFSGERDDFSAVPVAVWPSTFSGQRPGRAGTVPVRYWSCPA